MNNTKHHCVAITGGIGSGKSTAVNFFHQYGAHIIDADKIARDLVQPGKPAYQALLEHFFTVDRAQLRQIIFSNPMERQWLENYLHPLIRQEIECQMNNYMGKSYIIIDIPLLKRKSDYPFVDRVLVIDCPEDLQIQRIMQRDHITADQAKKMLQAQISREERNALADDYILNDAALEKLKNAVNILHHHY